MPRGEVEGVPVEGSTPSITLHPITPMFTDETDDKDSLLDDGRTLLQAVVQPVIKKVQLTLGLSLGRVYELVGHANPYPKTMRLLGALAPHNPQGVRQIQCDFNARVEAMLEPFERRETCVMTLHRECAEAISATLEGKSPTERKVQIREAIAELQAAYMGASCEELDAVIKQVETEGQMEAAGGVQ